jgi:5'-3' exonuclease
MLRKKPFLFTREGFMEKYNNLTPPSWALVKAIGGCKSDNISGLKGIGEKRALQYVTGETSDKMYKSIYKRWIEYNYWSRFTTLPYNGVLFKNLSLDTTKIDWDDFTKWCQIYGLRKFIIQYTKFREAFDFR